MGRQISLQNLHGRTDAEVLRRRGGVNGRESAPGTARVQAEAYMQTVFPPGGQVAVPVWGEGAEIRYDDPSQLEYLTSSEGTGRDEGLAGRTAVGRHGRQETGRIRVEGLADSLTVLFFQHRQADNPRLCNLPLRLEVRQDELR